MNKDEQIRAKLKEIEKELQEIGEDSSYILIQVANPEEDNALCHSLMRGYHNTLCSLVAQTMSENEDFKEVILDSAEFFMLKELENRALQNLKPRTEA